MGKKKQVVVDKNEVLVHPDWGRACPLICKPAKNELFDCFQDHTTQADLTICLFEAGGRPLVKVSCETCGTDFCPFNQVSMWEKYQEQRGAITNKMTVVSANTNRTKDSNAETLMTNKGNNVGSNMEEALGGEKEGLVGRIDAENEPSPDLVAKVESRIRKPQTVLEESISLDYHAAVCWRSF